MRTLDHSLTEAAEILGIESTRLLAIEAMEKYIPFKIDPKSNRNSYHASFEIPGSYAPESSGHDQNIPIKFTVNIGVPYERKG